MKTQSLCSPSAPIVFPQMQKPLSSVLLKRNYSVSMRMHSKSAQSKLANHKRHHAVKFQDEVWLLLLKKQLGSKEETFCCQKMDCN